MLNFFSPGWIGHSASFQLSSSKPKTLSVFNSCLGTWMSLLLKSPSCLCLFSSSVEISLAFFSVSLSGYQQFLCLPLARTHFHLKLLRWCVLFLCLFSFNLVPLSLFYSSVLAFCLSFSSSSSVSFYFFHSPITNSLNPAHTYCQAHPPTWPL